MGSFDKICGISGMTIRGGEKCYVTRLEKNKHVYRQGANVFDVKQEWQPISFPQLTTYFDYGEVDPEFKPSPINAALRLDVHGDEEERVPIFTDDLGAKYHVRDTLFLVHQKVYEKLSSEIIVPDMYGYKADIYKQGPQFFIDAYKKFKEDAATSTFMIHRYLESSRIFGFEISSIGDMFLNDYYKHKDFVALDSAFELGLADELYKTFVFEENMDALWKHYRPSNYGGQQDNYKTSTVLANVVRQIAADKQNVEDYD